MNDLIKVDDGSIGGNLVQTVKARVLHEFLESKADFSTWIKQQIERARLVEGRDYLLHNFVDQLPSGAKHKTDYSLTIESAKHIGMMSGTDKGFEVRDYFLECEHKVKEIDPLMMLNDPAKMRTLLLGFTEQVIALESKVTEMTPKVSAFDRIATSDGSLCITDAAKTLQIQPRKFTQLLQEQHYLYRRPMGAGWLAYQDKIQQGLMEHKVTTGEKSNGTEWTSTQPRITAKGLTKLASIVQQGGMH